MRVLVVDDDADTRVILRTMFEASGYEVQEAGDGREALRLALALLPDAVLMDLRVPGMDGWQVTRALRDNPATTNIPVIAISAHALPEYDQRAREAGCVGYLTKPVEPTVVLEEVEWILRTGITK